MFPCRKRIKGSLNLDDNRDVYKVPGEIDKKPLVYEDIFVISTRAKIPVDTNIQK